MIYSFGMEKALYYDLLKYLPFGQIRDISNKDKLLKMVKPEDFVLFFTFTKDARKIQRKLNDMGVKMFPDINVSLFIENRIKQLEQLKPVTKFNIERQSYMNDSGGYCSYEVPKLSSNKVVVKIGEYHQGKNKLLKLPGSTITTKENVLFEQFVENARSIRILMITDDPDDIFIVEQINSQYVNPKEAWIKNINPDEYVYPLKNASRLNIPNIDDIVADAKNIKKYLSHDYLGMDYVVGKSTTGFLEVNDMIGLPDDDMVYERAKLFFRNLVENI